MSQNHRNMESVVETLANEHFEIDESLEKVIWIKSGKTPAIRLLEINPETPPTGRCCRFIFRRLTKSLMLCILQKLSRKNGKKFCKTKFLCPKDGAWRTTKNFLVRWLPYDGLEGVADGILRTGSIRKVTAITAWHQIAQIHPIFSCGVREAFLWLSGQNDLLR